ncbi:hypothetical protein D3C84_613720 [compost metagenome]
MTGGPHIEGAPGFHADGEPRQVAGQRFGVVNEPFQLAIHLLGVACIEHADVELEGARRGVGGFFVPVEHPDQIAEAFDGSTQGADCAFVAVHERGVGDDFALGGFRPVLIPAINRAFGGQTWQAPRRAGVGIP